MSTKNEIEQLAKLVFELTKTAIEVDELIQKNESLADDEKLTNDQVEAVENFKQAAHSFVGSIVADMADDKSNFCAFAFELKRNDFKNESANITDKILDGNGLPKIMVDIIK